MVAPTTRPYISAPMTRRFTRLAWTAATFTYLLIILGAIVRITGSGLGCGEHWPPDHPGLAPGVSEICAAGSELRHRGVRRAHRELGRRERVPRIPALQRPGRPGGQLPAAHPLGPPAARLHAVRLRLVVGAAHEDARGVVGRWSRHPSGRGRRRDGAARAAGTAPGHPCGGWRSRVGRAGPRPALTPNRQTRISSSCGWEGFTSGPCVSMYTLISLRMPKRFGR